MKAINMSVALFCILSGVVNASDVTISENGINSVGLSLPDGKPLNGEGVVIGQSEPHRPGDPKMPNGAAFDTMASLFNSKVDPLGVYFLKFDDTQNPTTITSFLPTVNGTVITPPPPAPPIQIEIDQHAVQVAGVMISSDTGTPSTAGVSPKAILLSIGHAGSSSQKADAVATQFIATANLGDVRAVNISFGQFLEVGQTTDGNSLITQFIDWSASRHNVLYAVGGTQLFESGDPSDNPVPSDNFNGITVARSAMIDGVYRKVSDENDFSHTINARTFVDLIAPGDDILLAFQGNIEDTDSGSSFAAPHVTGTVALLQQYADFQIDAGATNWGGMATDVPEPGPTAHRHEVMKAVLMNSADKIKDTTNYGKYLGMSRTVEKRNGDTWFQSEAYLELDGPLFDTPLDEEMGTGHLNAKRALQQFIPGEHEVNGHYGQAPVGDVPHIGWDFGTIAGTNFPINKYRIEGTLEAGNFFSATLAWDREVEFANDANMNDEFDLGDTFQEYTNLSDVLRDLDLYLVPAGTNDVGEADVLVSQSSVTSVEHIFGEIPETGEYELWVYRNNQSAPDQNYGLAWWYGLAPDIEPPDNVTGDFNSDGRVDGRDFLVWQRNPSVGNLSDWQNNYGTGAIGAVSVPEPSCLVLLLALIGRPSLGVRTHDRQCPRIKVPVPSLVSLP